MKMITSVTNEMVKKIAALHAPKGRKENGLFIAEGMRTIETLQQAQVVLHSLYVTEKFLSWAEGIATETQIVGVSEAVMQKISAAATPSGALALYHIPVVQEPLSAGLVLADITDPGNMGTLIRTAVACGIRTVVVVEGTDPWSPKVVQSTAGTIALTNIHCLSWQELLNQKNSLALYALVVQGGDTLNSITEKQNTLLVVGNEAHGIKKIWLDTCEHTITLPMHGQIESLNAAIAGSIALYITHMY